MLTTKQEIIDISCKSFVIRGSVSSRAKNANIVYRNKSIFEDFSCVFYQITKQLEFTILFRTATANIQTDSAGEYESKG